MMMSRRRIEHRNDELGSNRVQRMAQDRCHHAREPEGPRYGRQDADLTACASALRALARSRRRASREGGQGYGSPPELYSKAEGRRYVLT